MTQILISFYTVEEHHLILKASGSPATHKIQVLKGTKLEGEYPLPSSGHEFCKLTIGLDGNGKESFIIDNQVTPSNLPTTEYSTFSFGQDAEKKSGVGVIDIRGFDTMAQSKIETTFYLGADPVYFMSPLGSLFIGSPFNSIEVSPA